VWYNVEELGHSMKTYLCRLEASYVHQNSYSGQVHMLQPQRRILVAAKGALMSIVCIVSNYAWQVMMQLKIPTICSACLLSAMKGHISIFDRYGVVA